MPKETSTPVERGPGSVSPDFTPPQVGVATPGRNLRAASTDAETFRDAILSFGRGVGNAVSARAAINSRMNALKERAVAKVEGDLNRAARAFQARRLESADAKRRELLSEAAEGNISLGQLESELRSRMVNAHSAQEASIWESSWQKTVGQIEQDNAEEKRQAFNRARMTMQSVIAVTSAEIEEDQALKASLIGDGQGIAGRVQNHVLAILQESADLDSMTTEDAELLIHQATMQSAAIADQLRSEHQALVEDANERTGGRQLEADLFSTASGDQAPEFLRDQIEVTLRDKFGHMTPEQQESMVRDALSGTLDRMVGGDFGLENFDLDAARAMLNQTVNGQKVFTASERQQMEARLFQQAERTLSETLEGEVAKAREDYSQVITLPDGEQVRVPAENADALLTLKNENGVSRLDLLADRLMDRVVGGKEGPAADRLRGIIRDAQAQIVSRVERGADKWAGEMLNTSSYYSGGTVESTAQKNRAYHHSPAARVLRDPASLAAAGNQPPSQPEVAHLRQQYRRIAEAMGLDPEVVDSWDGSTIGTDNRALRQIAEAHHANLHNQRGEVPPAAVADKMALLTSRNTDDFAAAVSFFTTLDGGPDGPWQSFLNGEGLSESDRGALIHLRRTMNLGAISWSPDGAPIFQSPRSDAVDMEQLRAQVERIRQAPDRNAWLWARADPDDSRDRSSNLDVIAKSWAEGIMAQDDPALYGQADWDMNATELAASLQNAINTRTDLQRFVAAVAQSQSALNAGLEDEDLAAVVGGWFDRAGVRVKRANGQAVLLTDPHNYTGSPGGDLNAHADEALTRPFAPWYRSALAEALGVEPGQAPANLQALHLMGRTATADAGLIAAERDLTDTELREDLNVLSAFHGGTEADNQMRLLPTSQGGGSPIYVQTPEGVLASPTAVNDVTVTAPDGSTITISAGQLLSVYNPVHFVPRPRFPVRSANGYTPRPTPVVYQPDPRHSHRRATSSGWNAPIRNIPKE